MPVHLLITLHAAGVMQLVAAATPSPGSGVIPNPAPAAPAGIGDKASLVISMVKWGVLTVIILAGLAGAGAIAGGRIFSHHRSSQVGIGIVISAIFGAVVYAGIYALLMQFSA